MGQTPAELRKQMEKLEAKLAKAEAEERAKVEKKILRAANRSGLVKTEMSLNELTEKFAQIIEAERSGTDDFSATLEPAFSVKSDVAAVQYTDRLNQKSRENENSGGPKL